jgi:hypothetical protein
MSITGLFVLIDMMLSLSVNKDLLSNLVYVENYQKIDLNFDLLLLRETKNKFVNNSFFIYLFQITLKLLKSL